MPLYEYKCVACGNRFELLILRQSQTPACPSCSSESVEQLISSFAVSSEARRDTATTTARKYNEKLNSRQDPDKPRVQIDHPHQH
jgi:putative FmdB family regulatory protein